MNRKLRNSLTALTTCSVALVLALVGISPLIRAGAPSQLATLNTAPDGAVVGTTLIVTSASCTEISPCRTQVRLELPALAPATTVAPLTRNIKSATDAATTRNRGRRDNRQPLVMPYFSFAPRG